LTFKYDKLQNHILDKCVTADDLYLPDSEGAHTAPGVCAYSVPPGVAPPRMAVVVNLLAIPKEETAEPAQAWEDIEERYPEFDRTAGFCQYRRMSRK